MTAIRHVLRDVADGRYPVPPDVVAGLAVALDDVLDVYAAMAEDRLNHSGARRAPVPASSAAP